MSGCEIGAWNPDASKVCPMEAHPSSNKDRDGIRRSPTYLSIRLGQLNESEKILLKSGLGLNAFCQELNNRRLWDKVSLKQWGVTQRNRRRGRIQHIWKSKFVTMAARVPDGARKEIL